MHIDFIVLHLQYGLREYALHLLNYLYLYFTYCLLTTFFIHNITSLCHSSHYYYLVITTIGHYSICIFKIIFAFLGGTKNDLNASEEDVIEFGTPKASVQNYPENFEEMWYLIVPEGRQVEISFDTFQLEQSDNCENDYLEIREAYFKEPHDPQDLEGRSGPILANSPYCGSTNPGTIQSAGNMVWVHFKTDSNATTTFKG